LKLRLIVLLCAALALTVGVATATAGGGTSGGGNSANAKLCQKGGWTKWVTAEQTPFASEEACVAYAAAGFTLTPAPADLSVSLTPSGRVVLTNTWSLTVSNAGPGSASGVIVDFYCDAPASAILEEGNSAPGDNPDWHGERVTDYHVRLSYALPLASGATSPKAPINCNDGLTAGTGHVEISASSVADPDSTPNNGVTTEDDYAALVPAADLSVSLSPVGPPWESTVVPNALAVTVKNSGPAPADGVSVDLYCDRDSPDPVIGGFIGFGVGIEESDPTHDRFHLSPIDPGTVGGQQWRFIIFCETRTGLFADFPPVDLRTGHVEISASSVPDPDSTPNNGVTTEDDYAAFGPGT
jgi:large repetitive protein